MTKTRYFIEAHKDKTPRKIHGASQLYHFVRLNADFIFGVAHLNNGHIAHCTKQNDIVLLPSLHSRLPAKSVFDAVKATAHWAALVQLGITDTDTALDVLEKLYAKTGHPHLIPEI